MIDKVFDYIAPHHCYLCQKVGVILCDSCENYISDEAKNSCIHCLKPSVNGICGECKPARIYTRAWYVAEREGVLRELLDDYKFERTKAIHKVLTKLLATRLPYLPDSTVIVPIPTISKHIRIRGYDHISLITKKLSQERKLTHSSLIKRKNQTVQLGKSAKERKKQIQDSFYCTKRSLDSEKVYLIVDDIYTTGSTVNEASRCLRVAGAKHIWVAVIARQPLMAH